MSETTPSADTALWRYFLNFYGQAGVSEACIALQDGCGVDVNLLVFLFSQARRGRQLSAADVKTLDSNVRSWRDLALVPVRELRRRLKGTATLLDAKKQEAFRDKVKTIEFEAERLQQEALNDFATAKSLGTNAAPSAAARANVAAYEGALGVDFPQASVALLLGAFDVVSAS